MKKIIFPILFSISISLPAQVDSLLFTNYHPLVSGGVIPHSFMESSVDKYNRERRQVEMNQGRSARIAEDQFYVYSNYFGDKLRYSGKVLVNDTISKYINRVGDKLLENDQALRGKIHFYTLREPYMNAFTTDGGDIYVNIGLISRLKNEAELAFILAHEIIHYKKRHILSSYRHDVVIKQDDKIQHIGDEDDDIIRKHSYSQLLELEADKEGLELYLAAGYRPQSAIDAFNLLALADYPFANEKISARGLESPYFTVPATLFPENDLPLEIPVPSKGSEASPTHPSLDVRIEKIKERIATIKEPAGVTHFLPEDEFRYIILVAKFEEIHLLNNSCRYIVAIYSSLALQNYFPNSLYLKKEILRGFLGHIMLNNRQDDDKHFRQAFEMKKDYCEGGEFAKFWSYMKESTREGIDVGAIVYGMELHKQYPSDEGIHLMLKGLMREMLNRDGVEMTVFKSQLDSLDPLSPLVVSNSYGNDSIRKINRAKEHPNSLGRYWRYAFIPYLEDPYFKSLIIDAADYKIAKEKRNFAQKKIELSSPRELSNKSDTLHMDLDAVMVVAPQYYCIDINSGDGVDFKKTLKKEANLTEAFLLADTALPIKVHMLAQGGIDSTNASDFNLLMCSNDWLDQKLFYEDEEITPFYPDSVINSAARHNAEYVTSTVMLSFTRPRENKMMLLFVFLYMPLPRSVFFLVTPHFDTYFYSTIYNLKTGLKYAEVFRVMPGQNDNKSRINQNVYDFLYQLDRK